MKFALLLVPKKAVENTPPDAAVCLESKPHQGKITEEEKGEVVKRGGDEDSMESKKGRKHMVLLLL